MDLLPGVEARSVATGRLRTHYYQAGPDDGIPVVMIHGNLSTGRFFEHLWPGAPDRYRFIAPDMRSFGRSDPAPIDATRGLDDWADDTRALVEALGIESPPHLVGWSTGGAAIASYAMNHPVASLTLIDPVSPRNVMTSSYWSPEYRLPPEREEILVDEVLLTVTGDDGYTGDLLPSENWPGVAPGTRGILNALSGKYCNWAGLADLAEKPPVLWTHGSNDIVVADGSMWEMGSLGQMGVIPGWPGDDAFPPQPMVSQIRDVLERYADNGGRVEIEMFEGSGHGPHIDAADRWSATFFAFLASID